MTPANARRTVLFHRDFRGFTGGHLKVWHYFCHVAASPAHEARIHFTPASRLDASNPWHHSGSVPSSPWTPSAADVLFLAGMDWKAVPGTFDRPVVNLIQGFGHARAGDPRHDFLARRAIRICVSEEVAEAIRATGRTNGPIVTIPNALDHEALPPPAAVRDVAVLVAGQKRPELARELAERLERCGIAVRCLTEPLPRAEFLSLLGRAEIVVPLPLPEEGFFLPGLEGMAMGALVVCPDCHGNRSWCRDNETGFRPLPTIDAIEAAVTAAHGLSPASRKSIVAQAQTLARSRSMADERNEFLHVLTELDDML
jgi:hypothetical protein